MNVPYPNKPIHSILVIYTTDNNSCIFRYIRTRDGASCEGYLHAGQNNILKAFHYDDVNGWRTDYFYTVHEIGSRKFNKMIKEDKIEYTGSSPENILKFAMSKFEDGKLV